MTIQEALDALKTEYPSEVAGLQGRLDELDPQQVAGIEGGHPFVPFTDGDLAKDLCNATRYIEFLEKAVACGGVATCIDDAYAQYLTARDNCATS